MSRRAPNPTGKGGFKKGKSGNPAGRPKVIGELRDLAREHTMPALQTLIDVAANKGEAGSARVSAANAILDRGYGKPSQEVQHTGKDGEELSMKFALADDILALLRSTPPKGE